MLLPIRDENPIPGTPWVNYMIIAACAAVFLWQNALDDAGPARFIREHVVQIAKRVPTA